MTERTIRMTAKELAGAYYEENHTPRFRQFWKDQRVFMARNWPTFVPMAREVLVAQLNDKSTSVTMKDAIAAALIEDREKSFYGIPTKVGYSTTHTLNPEHPGRRERKIFYDE